MSMTENRDIPAESKLNLGLFSRPRGHFINLTLCQKSKVDEIKSKNQHESPGCGHLAVVWSLNLLILRSAFQFCQLIRMPAPL